MGTLAEDIVAPGVREIARKCFGCGYEDDFMVRRFKKNGIYAMATKEDMMDLMNFESVKPKFCNEPQMNTCLRAPHRQADKHG